MKFYLEDDGRWKAVEIYEGVEYVAFSNSPTRARKMLRELLREARLKRFAEMIGIV